MTASVRRTASRRSQKKRPAAAPGPEKKAPEGGTGVMPGRSTSSEGPGTLRAQARAGAAEDAQERVPPNEGVAEAQTRRVQGSEGPAIASARSVRSPRTPAKRIPRRRRCARERPRRSRSGAAVRGCGAPRKPPQKRSGEHKGRQPKGSAAVPSAEPQVPAGEKERPRQEGHDQDGERHVAGDQSARPGRHLHTGGKAPGTDDLEEDRFAPIRGRGHVDRRRRVGR